MVVAFVTLVTLALARVYPFSSSKVNCNFSFHHAPVAFFGLFGDVVKMPQNRYKPLQRHLRRYPLPVRRITVTLFQIKNVMVQV